MKDAIVTTAGRPVGTWDGQKIETLKEELARIKREFKAKGSAERVTKDGIPHADQMPPDFDGFTAYIIWGCDSAGNCLVGSGANRTETATSIREFYANDIAKDAAARDRA